MLRARLISIGAGDLLLLLLLLLLLQFPVLVSDVITFGLQRLRLWL